MKQAAEREQEEQREEQDMPTRHEEDHRRQNQAVEHESHVARVPAGHRDQTRPLADSPRLMPMAIARPATEAFDAGTVRR